ncbi:MAG: tetratricopeptide repeat protein [Deltaproteobacteria bacterium]|nr:tetratricopeptide repeat protein [Deltaproteobacteria bacterium]
METDVEKRIAELLAAAPRAEHADVLCREGEDLVPTDLETARELFDRALKVDPRSVRAWTGRGTVLSRAGRQGEAIGCLDRALELDPTSSRALVTKADVLLRMGLRDEALACYDRATAATPDEPHVWIHRARMLEEMGRPHDALDALENALRAGESPTLRARQAELLLAMGRGASAVKCLERAVHADPTTSEWWYRLGVGHANLRNEDDARLAFTRFFALAPKDPRVSEARTILEQMARHGPSRGAPAGPIDADEEEEDARLAPVVHTRDPDDEDDWLVERRSSRPSDDGAREGAREGARADATSEGEAAPDPRSLESRYEEAQSLLLLGRHVEALRVLDELVKDGSSSVEVQMARAQALATLGEPEAAVRAAEQAACGSAGGGTREDARGTAEGGTREGAPADAARIDAQLLYARLLLDVKSDQQALDVVDRVLEARPDDAEAHRLRGRALVALARHVESIFAFEKAALYAPEDAEAWFLLGRTLRLLRRAAPAKSALEKARILAKAKRQDLVAPIESLLEKLG